MFCYAIWKSYSVPILIREFVTNLTNSSLNLEKIVEWLWEMKK